MQVQSQIAETAVQEIGGPEMRLRSSGLELRTYIGFSRQDLAYSHEHVLSLPGLGGKTPNSDLQALPELVLVHVARQHDDMGGRQHAKDRSGRV